MKVLPGVRVNINTNSTSVTIGGRGFKTTISKHGTRRTIGIPGTGISYTEYERHSERKPSNALPERTVHYSAPSSEPAVDDFPGITLGYYLAGSALSAVAALRLLFPIEDTFTSAEPSPLMGRLFASLALFLIIRGCFRFYRTKQTARRAAEALAKERAADQELERQRLLAAGVWDQRTDPRFPCPHCRKIRRTKEALEDHIRAAHGPVIGGQTTVLESAVE